MSLQWFQQSLDNTLIHILIRNPPTYITVFLQRSHFVSPLKNIGKERRKGLGDLCVENRNPHIVPVNLMALIKSE